AHRAAERMATHAADSFRAAGRQQMVDHALSIAAHAALDRAVVDDAADALARATELADRLERSGWEQLADELRVGRLRVGRRIGAPAIVAGDVHRLRRGALSDRRDVALAGWYAEGLARATTGDLAAALDACRTGLDLLDGIVVEASTLEQRSAAVRLG